MWKAEKIANIVTVAVLAASCIYLECRISELENRIAVVENDQTLILDNMKKTVDLMMEIATRSTRQE
ncbi:MAG: hypothetical protein E7200_05320 [Selenomonas ruminantium]|nr:hypothetical protein [Selenomonas ruminantium]